MMIAVPATPAGRRAFARSRARAHDRRMALSSGARMEIELSRIALAKAQFEERADARRSRDDRRDYQARVAELEATERRSKAAAAALAASVGDDDDDERSHRQTLVAMALAGLATYAWRARRIATVAP